MKTESILQSFQYAEKVNILLYYGRETETLQIIQPLSSFHNQARMHPWVTRYKLMKPIEKTIHSPNDGSKTQAALFTLVLAMLFPYYRFTQNWNNLSARMQRWNKNTGCLKYLNSFWWSASLAQTSQGGAGCLVLVTVRSISKSSLRHTSNDCSANSQRC